MEISLNDIPYISLLFLALLKYNNFTDIKQEFCNSDSLPIKLILLLVTILILSIIVEYNLGHYFILLLILVGAIILDGDNKDKNKQNLDDKLFNIIIFLFGAFIVTSCYVAKKDITKWLFIILGLCILFGVNYLVLVTSNPSNKLKLKKLIKNGILGVLIPSLVLLWCENERKPLIKYVKLFYRKGQQ